MKKPDMLVPIAVWEFFTAAIIIIPISALIIIFFANVPDWRMWMVDWDGPNVMLLARIAISFVILIFIAYFVLAVMGGIWLLQGHEMGRTLSIVHGALSLLCIPIGTVVGALVLVYLTRPEVRDYFQT